MEETEKKRKGRPRKNTQAQKSGEMSVVDVAENTDSMVGILDEKVSLGEKKTTRKVGRPRKVAAESAEKIKTTKKDLEKEPAIVKEKLDIVGEGVEKTKQKHQVELETAKVLLKNEVEVEKKPRRGRVKKSLDSKNVVNKELSTSVDTEKSLQVNIEEIAGNTENIVKNSRLAIQANARLALEKSKTKELPINKNDNAVLAKSDKMDLTVYTQGQLVPFVQDTIQENIEEASDKAEKNIVKPHKKVAENKKTLVSQSHKQKGKKVQQVKYEQERDEDVKEVVDFVAGVNGIAEYNGEESLSEFGEQAGLGVFGVIEEAPLIDTVLPLLTDSEKSEEEKPSLKPRKRGRKKKAVKNSDSLVTSTEFLQEFDNSPIVEDGELARIEAEESLRNAQKKKKVSDKKEKKETVRRVLYVSTVPEEQVEVVITENGVVSEYFVEMAHQSKIRGNIYKGVINNVDTNLQAAFVNFGCGKNGFLQIDEVHPEYYLTPHEESGSKYPPIQKVLKAGQEVLVQVVKEPNGSKGAFLTTWLSLAGRFLVLTPGQEQIGVSRKVEDSEERQRLRALLNGIKPGENMGVIIRTVSEGASKTSIQKDLQLLKRSWKNIQKQVLKSPAPSLVYQEADLAVRAVRDYLNDEIDEVWVDSKDVQKSIADLVAMLFPKNKDMVHLHEDIRQTLWERFNIARQLEEVTKREVNLPSGGRLVFDQTEALMAIDINSGKSQGKNNFEAMVYRTNMEAVEAIARHLRLRDIGGQVVIDFIEMRDKNHCRDVEKALHTAMKRDRARHDIGKLSSFGLLELVRQRTGSSVISITSEPCPHCRGTGFRRNLEWQAQGVLREIRSKLAGKNVPTTYVHHVEQEIAFYLLNKKRDRLTDLEQEFGVHIEIHLK